MTPTTMVDRDYVDRHLRHERELVDEKFESRDKALLLQVSERESRMTMRLVILGLSMTALTVLLKVLWK